MHEASAGSVEIDQLYVTKTLHGLGYTSFRGLSLVGDRIISSEPRVSDQEDPDFVVEILGPNPRGELESSLLPLEEALRQARDL